MTRPFYPLLPDVPVRQTGRACYERQRQRDQDQVRQPLRLQGVNHWLPQEDHRYHVRWKTGDNLATHSNMKSCKQRLWLHHESWHSIWVLGFPIPFKSNPKIIQDVIFFSRLLFAAMAKWVKAVRKVSNLWVVSSTSQKLIPSAPCKVSDECSI